MLRQAQALGSDACALWVEGLSVVWLRSARLAAGGAAAKDEARLMVSEKLAAQRDLTVGLVTGRFGWTPLSVSAGVTRFFLDGVRDNRKRLSRS